MNNTTKLQIIENAIPYLDKGLGICAAMSYAAKPHYLKDILKEFPMIKIIAIFYRGVVDKHYFWWPPEESLPRLKTLKALAKWYKFLIFLGFK